MVYRIRMNTGHLDSDAQQINHSIQQIRTMLQNLRKESLQLDHMWDGPASESFREEFEGDLDLLEQNIGNLEKIYGFEEDIRERFDRCGMEVRTVISEI